MSNDKMTKSLRELLDKLSGARPSTSVMPPDTVAVPEGEPDFGYKEDDTPADVRILSLDEAKEMFGDDFLSKLFGGAGSLSADTSDTQKVFDAILAQGDDAGGCDIVDVLEEVHSEVHRARRKHKPMNSPHEGFAVLKEEVDELWDEIKSDNGWPIADGLAGESNARKEAIQIAAMAVRYILDLGKPKSKKVDSVTKVEVA